MFTFFFFNDTATTEIYTLSLHDALPICAALDRPGADRVVREDGRGGARTDRRPSADHRPAGRRRRRVEQPWADLPRSEEHTSELQSRQYLVCRLLLEKKKNTKQPHASPD